MILEYRHDAREHLGHRIVEQLLLRIFLLDAREDIGYILFHIGQNNPFLSYPPILHSYNVTNNPSGFSIL